jgi:hypothetical protein
MIDERTRQHGRECEYERDSVSIELSFCDETNAIGIVEQSRVTDSDKALDRTQGQFQLSTQSNSTRMEVELGTIVESTASGEVEHSRESYQDQHLDCSKRPFTLNDDFDDQPYPGEKTTGIVSCNNRSKTHKNTGQDDDLSDKKDHCGQETSVKNRNTSNDYNQSDNCKNEDIQGCNDSIRVVGHFQDRSIGELKALAHELHVNINSCIERKDVVNSILAAISEKGEHVMSIEDKSEKSISLNLSILQSEVFGIQEMRLLADIVGISIVTEYNCKESIAVALYHAASHRPRILQFVQSLEPVANSRTISDLRSVSWSWNVKIDDCLERSEMVQRLIQSKACTV